MNIGKQPTSKQVTQTTKKLVIFNHNIRVKAVETSYKPEK
jgi:hypothetical protein